MATNLSDEKLIEIFRGKVEDLPKKQSKIVSIFLSSTFSGKFLKLLIHSFYDY